MAALYRAPEGMLMSDLSRFLLVSNGNVTGIVDRLVSEGLVARARRNGDRRTSMVQADRGRHRAVPRRSRRRTKAGSASCSAASSEDETRRLAAMLKSFRSNWEGRE